MERQEGSYKVLINGSWSLEDLYVFPHTYEQVYFLLYSLLPHKDEFVQDRIKYAYSQFPWIGGYSTVNFYNKLKFTTPKKQRPQIISLKYASPGWIELSLILAVAFAVRRLVKDTAKIIKEANSVYNEIYKGMSERKLLRLDIEKKQIELEKLHAEYIYSSLARMAKMLGLENLEQMNEKTGSPLKTIKILLSLFRRVKKLAEYEGRGKTDI